MSNANKCADKNRYYVFDSKGKAVCPTKNKKSVDTIAREVIRGDWGNGDEHKRKLTAAGYDYSAVMKYRFMISRQIGFWMISDFFNKITVFIVYSHFVESDVRF